MTEVETRFTPNAGTPTRSEARVSGDDEIRAFVERAYGVNVRLSRGARAGGRHPVLTHTRTDAGSFAVEQYRLEGALSIAAEPTGRVATGWTTAGRVNNTSGDLTSRGGPGDITLLNQQGVSHRVDTEDLQMLSVLIEPALLAGAAGAPAADTSPEVRFLSLTPVSPAAGRLWKRTVDYIREDVLADDALATPLVLGEASRLLAAVTLSTFPHTTVATRRCDSTDHQPVLLRRAVEFIEANAAGDIALADIAEAVHISPRAVQYMFRRHLDTTPLQYLRRLRLHHARHDLMGAERSRDTVTAIAARWGFMHTGRFAVQYRQAYGQSPHATLRGE